MTSVFKLVVAGWFCATALQVASAAGTNAPPKAAKSPVDALNLTGGDYPAVRDSYLAAKSAADTARLTGLRPVLQRFVKQAEEMLKEKRKVRNVKGVAVATAAKEIFEGALTNLESRQELEFPEKIRRDLEPMMAEFRTAAEPCESAYSNALEQVTATHFARFAALVAKASPAAAAPAEQEKLKARFATFVLPTVAAPVSAGTDTNAPAASTNQPQAAAATNESEFAETTNAPSGAVPLPPGIFAASGEGSNWISIARWTGQMMGMDVINIPVTGREGSSRSEQYNMMSGENSKLLYASLRTLPPKEGCVFRLKRLPSMESVTVLEWPGARNGHTLIVRTSSSNRFPCPNGFELQVSLPDAELAALFPTATLEKVSDTNAPPVPVQIATEPAGAVVYVDSIAYRDGDGYRRTPCEIRVMPGHHGLRVALPGYLEMGVADYNFETNASFSWKFKLDPRATRKSIKISSVTPWTATGVKIASGDLVIIDPGGSWSCGTKKEPCGPEGYNPQDKLFYHYYLSPESSPRQFPGANYGALLMKVGDGGAPRAVGKKMKFIAKEDGAIYCDINEATDNRLRRDNAGAMEVQILVVPGKQASLSER
jgi:hypothetical protein